MKHIYQIIFILIASTSLFSACQSNESIPISAIIDTDSQFTNQEFIHVVGSDLMMEDMAADLALKHSIHPEVKELAKTVKSDYEKAGNHLKGIAARNGWEYPDTISNINQMRLQMLKDNYVTSNSFDTLYLNTLIMEHKATLAKINDYLDTPDFMKEEERLIAENQNSGASNTLADSSQSAARFSPDTYEDESNITQQSHTLNNPQGSVQDTGSVNINPIEDVTIQVWINETLPVIKNHLKRSKDIQNQLLNN